MGLFDKKYCGVCGEKIGLMGNRKLEDANLCKNCAAKLSPWFSERRASTLSEIEEQLEYREQNKNDVAMFNVTRTLGVSKKILIDEDRNQFMVTSARDINEANPDVLDFTQITGCYFDIDDRKTEMKTKGPDGKDISYNPPQYKTNYDFYMVIQVNHPYFNEMKFKLNDSSIEIKPNVRVAPGVAPRPVAPPPAARPHTITVTGRPGAAPTPRPGMTAKPGATPVRPGVAGRPGVTPPVRPGVTPPVRPGAAGRPGMPPMHQTVNVPVPPVRPDQPVQQTVQPANRVIGTTGDDPFQNQDYVRFYNLGNEIVDTLTYFREEGRESGEATPRIITCPWCGSKAAPDEFGHCRSCGGNL